MTIKDKLKSDPPKEYITTVNGVRQIPANKILDMLDSVFSSFSIRDYRFDLHRIGNKTFATASLTIITSETHDSASRVLSGTATRFLNGNEEYDISSVLYDDAVCNAAKKLGNYFGRNLEVLHGIVNAKAKPKPDMLALQQMFIAKQDNDVVTIALLNNKYDFSDTDTNTNLGLKTTMK